MSQNYFVPVAAAAGANVTSDANWDGSSFQVSGVTKGIVPSAGMNKAWRQGTMAASALGQMIVDHGLIDAADDGNVAGLKANLRMAFAAMLAGVAFAVDQSTTANIITAVLDPIPPTINTYRGVYIRVANTNTGAVTLALNNLGAKNIVKKNGTALAPGDIQGGQFVHFVYDLLAGQWVLSGLAASDILSLVVIPIAQKAAPANATTLTAGTGVFTVPPNIYRLTIKAWGAGGGGGCGQTSTAAGGGGSAGGYAETVVSVTPGQTLSYAVGAGGAGGYVSGGNLLPAINGGSTSIAGIVSVPGGLAGASAASGGGGSTSPAGAPSGGYLNINGGGGAAGYVYNNTPQPGVGGFAPFGNGSAFGDGSQGPLPGGGGGGNTGGATAGKGGNGLILIFY